ncbi:MFS transporter [Nostocoides australiense]|nr:MFS transporter [Tetrasphaera sp.]HPF82024.1 MFS transporter [Tetrasphaera australiensis]HRW03221.1 MFS transporter [Tetrasphaera sp.]
MNDPKATTVTGGSFRGTDTLLAGLVLSIVSYWLFAVSLGTVAPAVLQALNGPYADPAAKTWAGPLLITGRAIQGLSAACVMPATIAMVKAYWDGADRQRAVSMCSIGSFGGAGLAAFLGGLIATTMGWRWIFVFSIVVSLVASLLVWGTPESRVGADPGHRRFDIAGLAIFLVMLLALMMLLTFGGKTFGWLSGTGLALLAVALVGLAVFIAVERGRQGHSSTSASSPI